MVRPLVEELFLWLPLKKGEKAGLGDIKRLVIDQLIKYVWTCRYSLFFLFLGKWSTCFFFFSIQTRTSLRFDTEKKKKLYPGSSCLVNCSVLSFHLLECGSCQVCGSGYWIGSCFKKKTRVRTRIFRGSDPNLPKIYTVLKNLRYLMSK